MGKAFSEVYLSGPKINDHRSSLRNDLGEISLVIISASLVGWHDLGDERLDVLDAILVRRVSREERRQLGLSLAFFQHSLLESDAHPWIIARLRGIEQTDFVRLVFVEPRIWQDDSDRCANAVGGEPGAPVECSQGATLVRLSV